MACKSTCLQIIYEWNKQADGYNQWEKLNECEKIEFAFKCGRGNFKRTENFKKERCSNL